MIYDVERCRTATVCVKADDKIWAVLHLCREVQEKEQNIARGKKLGSPLLLTYFVKKTPVHRQIRVNLRRVNVLIKRLF